MIITILIFGLILGVLIFVHELGHFLTAKKNGITAHEFGFGFPPRIFGVVKDEKTQKWIKIWGTKEYYGNNTLYSINLIPLGGFVRIKGESPVDVDQLKNKKLSPEDRKYIRMVTEPDSFAVQSKFVRFKVLIAGVTMNFILAWILVSITLMIGAPEPKGNDLDQSKIVNNIGVQVVSVEAGSPADKIGLKIGDNIKQICVNNKCTEITTAVGLRNTILSYQGKKISIYVLRGKSEVVIDGVPRVEVEDSHGALGISMTETVIIRYPWYEAIWEGLMRVIGFTIMILTAFWAMINNLLSGQGVSAEVAGPIGIAMMTQQMRELGFVYLLQFTAILSVNLAIINILPIPALDGGRIIFLIIEAIKGKPVNQKIENMMHTIFFIALMLLMVVITVKDVIKLF